MSSIVQPDRITSTNTGADLLVQLIAQSIGAQSESEFLAIALQRLNQITGGNGSAIVQGTKGQWRILAHAGEGDGLPEELLAEVLDAGDCRQAEGWTGAPLYRGQTDPFLASQLVVVNVESKTDTFDSTAAAIGLAYDAFRSRLEQTNRARRLEAMLDMTVRWNQSRQTDELLEQIAETSTRLLGAERATIFLPDASGQQLIGKPATGVEGGEITIPINAGVVGQVMQTGTPARVDDDVRDEQQQIHREIDEQLNFQTRNLLCVPMLNVDGKTIGAFELINRLEGNFTDRDESALMELAAHATVAIDNTQHVEHLVISRQAVAAEAAGQVEMIGECDAIIELKKTIERVAGTELVVLITGENGTGKEVVAQMIHYLSPRRDEVMVAVNCAAITQSLLESELFGHEKGAFTDAHQAREGKFELASDGTLFLDEIGDMSLDGQSKLLRVLEEKKVVRVGGSTPIPTDARVIAATNQDLAALIGEKKFRQDLYFRLNVLQIELPALRDRGDDILLLAEHFLGQFCAKARRSVPKFSASVKKQLLQHHWPGNIRELRNMMERFAYLTDGDRIESADLAFVSAPESGESKISLDLPLTEATKEFQVDYIERNIKRSKGNMTDAAQRMGLHRSNLYRKMKQLGMSGEDDESLDDHES
ncbi:MAG: sigma-54-dependent Fis family transcriptional regulator [Planctomycetota bacterium]